MAHQITFDVIWGLNALKQVLQQLKRKSNAVHADIVPWVSACDVTNFLPGFIRFQLDSHDVGLLHGLRPGGTRRLWLFLQPTRPLDRLLCVVVPL